MKFEEQPIEGLYLIRPERREDERGYFQRIFCESTFRSQGLEFAVLQTSMSYSAELGTLRGLHFQQSPHGEEKLIRCCRGAVWDVLVDVRPDSSTYGKWCSFELRAEEGNAIFVPKGLAHGFLTLEPHTEMHYMMSSVYVPDAAGGVRWNDPDLAIDWPFFPQLISERDRNLPFFSELQ